MTTIFERLQAVWDSAKAGKAKKRAHFAISRDYIDKQLGPPFEPKKYYLQVRINEMFLAHEREWFAKYDPMVFAVGSYIYGKKLEASPYVIGPAMLEEFGQQVPLGMIFENTPVSGLHPYQGGPLTLTIILSKVERENNADKLLQVVEGISGAIAPSAAFSTYLEIAGTVMDGVEAILGLDETKPVVGYRTTINPDVGDMLEPAYFALIDEEEMQLERDWFWVRDSRLYYGKEQATAQPYRDNDFVLYSIAQGDSRHDEMTLPFYPLWETARDLAARPESHFWKEAKAQFSTLLRSLLDSPDLTKPDSDRLTDEYYQEIQQIRKKAALAASLTPGKGLSDEEAELRRRGDGLDVLDEL